MPGLNRGHLFISCLKQEGVQKAFTIVGDRILPFVDTAADERIEVITCGSGFTNAVYTSERPVIIVAGCAELSEGDPTSTTCTCRAARC